MSMHRHHRPLQAMSEINVTNLLDTAFILIVVLMVVAPLMNNGIKLALPEGVATQSINSEADKTVLVSVKAKESAEETEHIIVDNKWVTADELLTRVQAAKAKNADVTVQVEADKNCSYGAIFSVLDAIKQAGVDNVDLSAQPKSTEPEPKSGKKKDELK